MTVRNPLVLIPGGNPQIQELPAGDSIGGAAQGPVGMTWQGTWNSGTSYVVDDAVEYDGSAYIAIQAGTNQTPDPAGTAYWDLLASKGDTGATGATGATGPSGGDCVKISKVVTSSSQSTITFSSIPGTYTNLEVRLWGRDTASGSGNLDGRMKINGDGTSGNYSNSQQLFYNGTSTGANSQAANSDGGICHSLPGTSNNANAMGTAFIRINGYASTAFHKLVDCECQNINGSGPTLNGVRRYFVWKNTAAITDLVIKAGGTAFVDGTIAVLYGMN